MPKKQKHNGKSHKTREAISQSATPQLLSVSSVNVPRQSPRTKASKQISKIENILKSTGKTEVFDPEKLYKSILLAGRDTKAYGKVTAGRIYKKVLKKLATVRTKTISSLEVRNIVEPMMAEEGYFQTARYYILYKERKEQLKRKEFKVREPEIGSVALEIAKKRYLRTNMKGEVIETPGEMFWRVAKHFAKPEINWSDNETVDEMAKKFYERMVNWKFVCSGKAMFEAGNPGGTGQLSACFVLPIEDSIPSIFKTLGDAAVVQKNNGGTGFNFSKIRPHGDKVRNVPGAASGPVDFLKAYSAALAQILQGAKRQGANIAILNVDHPDVIDFILLKDQDGTIKNFNISVGVTNEFMEAVERDEKWELKNPRNGEVWKKVKARELFNMIAEHAWVSGDPGLAFLDRMEEDNPTPTLGPLNATNPCGEIPLHPYESCNLTSICLHKHLKQNKKGEYEVDWDDLETSVRLSVRFLDNMIEINTYALKEIENMVKYGNRRIGVGVMGLAHLLYKMKIPYRSKEAVRISESLAKFIQKTAESESIALAKVRGVFPNFDISIYAGTAERYRNCATTMVAPTGTISMLADTSSGIEPVFSLVTLKRVFNEDDKANRPTREFMMIDPIFDEALDSVNFARTKSISMKKKLKNKDEVLEAVANYGIEDVVGLPKWFYDVFVTTHDIEPEWHVRTQAAWQKWFDNSISKTVNFSNSATVDDVKKTYLLAWKLGCKGITIYRDGSKQDQVLNVANTTQKKEKSVSNGNGSSKKAKLLMANDTEMAMLQFASLPTLDTDSQLHVEEKCVECGGKTNYQDGCVTCLECGWSKCKI